jgi:multidrug efflux pump subunit AcrA (membrane-fusion protein)
LLAPFAGQVAIRYLDAGAMLSAGHAVVRIVGGAALRLRFAVVPEQAPRVVPGTIVRARIDTVAALVPAVVRQVSPALDPASGLLFVEAELQAGAEVSATLRPGLPAMVQVP